ncbi:TIR domain-containing protein [Actinokineospora sp. 24-640]
MGTVFVSYRRAGALVEAAAIANSLALHFGHDQVFIDTRLSVGDRYPDELEDALAASAVVVAVIHDGWVGDFTAERHKDWVHHELLTALREGKTVIPVLLVPARNPEYGEVPADIAAVTLIQSTVLRFTHYPSDIAELITAVERTGAAGEVPVTVAEPTGDLPSRPRLRLALSAMAAGLVFGGLPPLLALAPPTPAWWRAFAAAGWITTVVLAVLTAFTVLMTLVSPRLGMVTKRDQERSMRKNLSRSWPLAVLLLAVAVIWSVKLLFDVLDPSAEFKALLIVGVCVGFGWYVQRLIRRLSPRDTAWPPPVTPDPFTFRRAAARLHERLTADRRRSLDFAGRRQAESVYLALAEIRAVVEARTRRTWWQWLTSGRHGLPFPVVVLGTLGGVLALGVTGVVLALSAGEVTGRAVAVVAGYCAAAVALAAVALAVCHLSDRRALREQVAELARWDAVLRPLLYPPQPKRPD